MLSLQTRPKVCRNLEYFFSLNTAAKCSENGILWVLVGQQVFQIILQLTYKHFFIILVRSIHQLKQFCFHWANQQRDSRDTNLNATIDAPLLRHLLKLLHDQDAFRALIWLGRQSRRIGWTVQNSHRYVHCPWRTRMRRFFVGHRLNWRCRWSLQDATRLLLVHQWLLPYGDRGRNRFHFRLVPFGALNHHQILLFPHQFLPVLLHDRGDDTFFGSCGALVLIFPPLLFQLQRTDQVLLLPFNVLVQFFALAQQGDFDVFGDGCDGFCRWRFSWTDWRFGTRQLIVAQVVQAGRAWFLLRTGWRVSQRNPAGFDADFAGDAEKVGTAF